MTGDWLTQMKAGYKASYPRSSLDTQLQHHALKIGGAEADLQVMVLRKGMPFSTPPDERT